jgi:outer membrane protein OmpA-like peptidoglycan-associated protein
MRPNLLLSGAPVPRLLCTAVALSLALSACAPVRPAPGALAPVRARTTNEILTADLATIDAWERRRVALLSNDGADLAPRTVVLARAGAWLAFAREVYVARPRSPDADDALAEARRLIEAASGTSSGVAALSPAPCALLAAAQTLNPALYARLRELEGRPDAARRIATLADAEIELVRAAAARSPAATFPVSLAATDDRAFASAVALPSTVTSVSASGLACMQARHVARVERLLRDDMPDVRLAGGAELAAPDELRRNARTVHFALASDVLHEPSAALLDGVAGVMRQHPEVSLVIEGHADPRGADTSNLWLSGRRADGVRELLVGKGVDGDRVLVRMFGARRRDGTGTSVLDYARDRRVQLRFVLPDGTELPAIEDASDLQIEAQRLWSGALRPGLRRFVAEPGSTDVAPPVPVAPAKGKARARSTRLRDDTTTTPRGKS